MIKKKKKSKNLTFETEHGREIDEYFRHAIVVNGKSTHDVDELVIRQEELKQRAVVIRILSLGRFEL